MPEKGWYSLTVRMETAKRVRELSKARDLTVDELINELMKPTSGGGDNIYPNQPTGILGSEIIFRIDALTLKASRNFQCSKKKLVKKFRAKEDCAMQRKRGLGTIRRSNRIRGSL